MSAAFVDAAHAGQLLLEMRETGRHLPELPDGLRPGTLAEAYAIQDALHHAGGWDIAALKVGCTSEAAQTALSVAGPIAGRLAAATVHRSGVALDVATFHHVPFIECEFGLRLGYAVSPVDALPGQDGAWQLVDAVVPAIELVDSRYTRIFGASPLSLIADNAVAGAVVFGEAIPADGLLDLVAAPVRLSMGDEVIVDGTGAAVLGDPIRALSWMLDHEQRRGRGVAAGTVVITGTCTGLVPATVDVEIVADFEALGSVRLTLAS